MRLQIILEYLRTFQAYKTCRKEEEEKTGVLITHS